MKFGIHTSVEHVANNTKVGNNYQNILVMKEARKIANKYTCHHRRCANMAKNSAPRARSVVLNIGRLIPI